MHIYHGIYHNTYQAWYLVHFLYIPDILTHLWLNEILQNEGEGEQ